MQHETVQTCSQKMRTNPYGGYTRSHATPNALHKSDACFEFVGWNTCDSKKIEPPELLANAAVLLVRQPVVHARPCCSAPALLLLCIAPLPAHSPPHSPSALPPALFAKLCQSTPQASFATCMHGTFYAQRLAASVVSMMLTQKADRFADDQHSENRQVLCVSCTWCATQLWQDIPGRNLPWLQHHSHMAKSSYWPPC